MPRVTSKGQVTIPKEIRQLLGVSPGDVVEFQVADDRQVLVDRSSSPSCFSRYIGYLKHKRGQDSDQIVAELRGDSA